MKTLLSALLISSLLFAQNPNSAVFPGAVATDADLPPQVNTYQSTLGADITSSTTSGIVLGTTTGLVTQTILTIDAERMMVCEVTDGTHVKIGKSSCPNTDGRGLDNSTATSHSSLSNTKAVYGYFIALQYNQAASEIKAVETYISTHKTFPYGCAVGDPAGSALATGILCYIVVPMAGTITGWDIVVDGGTATVDVLKIATGTAKPTASITASALPAIATGTAIHSTTLTGWTTSVSANDIVGFNLTTVATAKYITVNIQVAH